MTNKRKSDKRGITKANVADSGMPAFVKMTEEAKRVENDRIAGWKFINENANSLIEAYLGKHIAVLRDEKIAHGDADKVNNFVREYYAKNPVSAKSIITGETAYLCSKAAENVAQNERDAKLISQSTPLGKFLKK